VIVGEGPALAEIQQDRAGLPVTFAGYLHDEALATAYASADIFAFPSRTETFGQVVLEAMSSGLPVVGVQSEGVCDLVIDKRTDLLDVQRSHQDEQVVSYRRLLLHLISNHVARRTMGWAGLIEAQQRSWPQAMDTLVQGYREVAETSRTLLAT
jgi:glycosyltransferase involved in cell wall biosynthesis